MKMNKKGAVTIEACVALPVFLSFFLLLLTVIRIAVINITLDHAVNEAAKQIAACAYPISYINEYEEKIITKYGEEKVNSFQKNIKEIQFNRVEDSGAEVLAGILSGGLSKALDFGENTYWSLKEKGKYILTKAIIDQYLEGNVNKSNISFKLVEFPQGEKEYEACKKSEAVKITGLIPEKDFCRDDVVIAVEYPIKLSFPVIGSYKIRLKHTAIERAWLKGGNGIYTEAEEGIKLEDLKSSQETVYITRTGERYHRGNCRYLRLSKIPVRLCTQITQRYTPCKVCKP